MQTQQQVSPQVIAEIAKEVVARLRTQMQPAQPLTHRAASSTAARDGVFATVDEAVNAAYEAQKKVAAMTLEDRERIIDIICRICNDRREELGRMELEETKVGRLDHKILKLTNMRFVLGVDALHTEARSNTTGLCIIEHAPWGVIGMMLPVTHSVPTMASNAINIVAAGNTAVFGPHPSGAKVAQYALQLVESRDRARAGRGQRLHHDDRADHRSRGADLSSSQSGAALLHRRRGGGARQRRKSGKRVIAGGPGNPPGGGGRNRRSRSRGALHHRRRGIRQQPALHRRKGSFRCGFGGRCVHRGDEAGRSVST